MALEPELYRITFFDATHAQYTDDEVSEEDISYFTDLHKTYGPVVVSVKS